MPTIKKRVNISLSTEMEDVLSKLSERDQIPQATKAVELIKMAIELEEDQFFDLIALERDRKGAKFVSHKKAWV